VEYLRECSFHVIVQEIYDGRCEVIHGVSLLASFYPELLLDVSMMIWNFDPLISKHPPFIPVVHTMESYRFVLQQMIDEGVIPLLGDEEVVDDDVLAHA